MAFSNGLKYFFCDRPAARTAGSRKAAVASGFDTGQHCPEVLAGKDPIVRHLEGREVDEGGKRIRGRAIGRRDDPGSHSSRHQAV